MGTLAGQVIRAGWHDEVPVIQLRHAGGQVESLPIGSRLDWNVGQQVTCTGRWQDGAWEPCPDHTVVNRMSQCSRCAPDLDCVFEPRCQSEDSVCSCDFGNQDHTVYVAYYGLLPKVGMTIASRAPLRAREQGADAWMSLDTLPNRGRARQQERRVVTLYGLPERRRTREMLGQLARPVPWDRIHERAAALRSRLASRYPDAGPLHEVRRQPLPLPLPTIPALADVAGRHQGEVIGAKGRFLVYRPTRAASVLDTGLGSPLRALPFQQLVGRQLAALPPEA